jgi:hypothetical protein
MWRKNSLTARHRHFLRHIGSTRRQKIAQSACRCVVIPIQVVEANDRNMLS